MAPSGPLAASAVRRPGVPVSPTRGSPRRAVGGLDRAVATATPEVHVAPADGGNEPPGSPTGAAPAPGSAAGLPTVRSSPRLVPAAAVLRTTPGVRGPGRRRPAAAHGLRLPLRPGQRHRAARRTRRAAHRAGPGTRLGGSATAAVATGRLLDRRRRDGHGRPYGPGRARRQPRLRPDRGGPARVPLRPRGRRRPVLLPPGRLRPAPAHRHGPAISTPGTRPPTAPASSTSGRASSGCSTTSTREPRPLGRPPRRPAHRPARPGW